MPGFPVTVKTIDAPTIVRGDTTITPQLQVFQFHISLPFYKKWWGWKRPAWVIVQAAGGKPERIPIIDITRILQVGIIGFGLMFVFLFGNKRRTAR